MKMDRETWLRTDDAAAMLAALRSPWPGPHPELERRVHLYYLACCRRIWPLLPGDAIRTAIGVTERHLDGESGQEVWDEDGCQAEVMNLLDFYLWDVYIGRELAGRASGSVLGLNGPAEHWELHCLARYEMWSGLIAEIPPSKLRKLVRTPPGCVELSPGEILYRSARFGRDVVHVCVGAGRGISDHDQFLSAHLLRDRFDYPAGPVAGVGQIMRRQVAGVRRAQTCDDKPC